MGGKGGGGGSGIYDYYGSIAGLICDGPVDELLSIIIDGKEAWPAGKKWAVGVAITTGQVFSFGGRSWLCGSNHTASTVNQPPNVTYWSPYSIARGGADYTDVTVVGYGTARIYWGTDTQTQDALLAAAGNDAGEDHPTYRGRCYIVLRDFLFGRERTSAPNVQVIVRRKPSQSIVTSTPTNLSDGQANMLTAVLEAATDAQMGLGLSSSDIDATSMQAVALNLSNSPLAWFASPLITQQTTIKSIAADLALLADAHIWFNPATKKLEAIQFLHGAAPASYVTLTTNDLVEIPSIESQSWQDAPTGVAIIFPDRERSGKDSSDKVDDLHAVKVVGENRRENITRNFITRRDQAIGHAAEYLRRYGRPQMEARVVVRREKARSITPGSWVLLDIDLEPNGTQLLQFFKVVEVSIPRRGPIELTLDAEETLAPIPYTPPVTIGQVPELGGAEEIPHYRIFEASFALAGAAGYVGCLAERPNLITVGFQLEFNDASTGTFQTLGIHNGFAVRATIRSDFADTDTGDMEITVPAQADTTLLSQAVSATEAADDTLLAIVFKISSGAIDTDADGLVHYEIMSVSNIALVSGGNYDLTVSRGVQGTDPHSFVVASAEVWIINRSSLSFFTHKEFETLRTNLINGDTPDTAWFIPQPFTYFDTLDIATLTATDFQFNAVTASAPKITINAPSWTTYNYTYADLTAGISLLISGIVQDFSGNLSSVKVVCRIDSGSETECFNEVASGKSKQFSVTLPISSSGTHVFTVRATTLSGLTSEVELIAIVDYPGPQLPTPVLYMSGDGNPATPWQYRNLVSQPASVGQWRSDWTHYRFEFKMPGYTPDILSTGGTVKVAYTSVGTTTPPGSGWINTVNTGGVMRTYYSSPTEVGSPAAVIDAASPGAFKLWWIATNPSSTDSAAGYMVFN